MLKTYYQSVNYSYSTPRMLCLLSEKDSGWWVDRPPISDLWCFDRSSNSLYLIINKMIHGNNKNWRGTFLFHVNPTISIYPHTHISYISPSYIQIYFSRLGCVIMCFYMRNEANVVVLSFISIKYCQIVHVQCPPHTVCVALSTVV